MTLLLAATFATSFGLTQPAVAKQGPDDNRPAKTTDIASMESLPSNPEFGFGPRQLIADLITTINTADAAFPWKDYDTDGDSYIDHVVLFHAGKDKSAGGGQQGYQALWVHRSSVPGDNADTPAIENTKYIASNGGTPDNPADDVRFAGYTMQQYEDVETGVLVMATSITSAASTPSTGRAAAGCACTTTCRRTRASQSSCASATTPTKASSRAARSSTTLRSPAAPRRSSATRSRRRTAGRRR